MNQQAIDILKAMKRKAEIKRWTWCGYMIDTIDEAIHKIEALWDGWINTAVQLPPEDTNVLIFEWWQSNLSWWNEPKIWWYNKKFWFQSLTDYLIATHWMNLPDSPK